MKIVVLGIVNRYVAIVVMYKVLYAIKITNSFYCPYSVNYAIYFSHGGLEAKTDSTVSDSSRFFITSTFSAGTP